MQAREQTAEGEEPMGELGLIAEEELARIFLVAAEEEQA